MDDVVSLSEKHRGSHKADIIHEVTNFPMLRQSRIKNEPEHDKNIKINCAPSEDSDQISPSLRCPPEERLGP